VALVEVDVVGAQPCERGVDLLEDLLAREAALAVQREEELRRQHIGAPGPSRKDFAQELLGATGSVDVRSVDEVDPDLERFGDAGRRLLSSDAAAVGQPGAEADLRNLEVARAQAAVPHR